MTRFPVWRSIESLEPRRLLAFADLVPSWGENGVGPDVRLLSEQADGKILAADNNGSNSPSHLVRLNADGSRDASFSGDGQVSFPAPIAAARQLADGKIVIAYTYKRFGDTSRDDDNFFGLGVARFNSSGGLDSAFGNRGNNSAAFRETKIGEFAQLADVAIADDGTAYLAVTGDTLNLGTGRTFSSFVLRFDAQGRIDSTFGGDGVVMLPGDADTPTHHSSGRTIGSITLRDRNSLLIAGTELRYTLKYVYSKSYRSPVLSAAATYVTRLFTDGTPDTRFATNGQFLLPKSVSPDYPNGDGEAAKILRQDDGRLLLVARTFGKLRVTTLNANGRPLLPPGGAYDDDVINTGDFDDAALLPNGSVIVSRQGVPYEARRTADADGDSTLGRFEFQAPRLPAAADGTSPGGGDSLLVLRDGDVLTDPYPQTVKISTGDGVTPRDDVLPGASQSSISTTTVDEGSSQSVPIAPLDAYYHVDNGGLKYRRRSAAGRWGRIETVDPAANAGVFLDGIGTSVVYTDGDHADLKFATRRKNGSWQTETIDSAGATGLYCSIVQTGVGTFAVAYYDRTKGDLRLARRAKDGTWTTETVDRGRDVGRFARIALRPHGGLSIAYAIGSTKGVRLAEQPAGGGAWTFADLTKIPVDVNGLDVGYFSTFIDSEDAEPEKVRTTVAFYDASRSDLFVAYRPDTGQKFTLLRDRQRGVAGQEPHVLSGGTRVSFYDQGRHQIRGITVEGDTTPTLVADALPIVANAGPISAPVTAYTVTGRYPSLGAFTKGYAGSYAWSDFGYAVKIRDPL